MKKGFFATVAMVLTACMLLGCCMTAAVAEDSTTWHLGICIHSMNNEYWAQEAAGAQLFASQHDDIEAEVLTCDSDDNKQLQGMKDFIAKYGDKAIFVVDPSSTANTVNIAELCEESGNYVTILAHREEGLFPSDFQYFVASLQLSDYDNGYKTAVALFESIGGKGQVAELQGKLGDDSAVNRHKGFEAAAAQYPDIEVVDSQTASWDQAQAMTLTENWIVKYPEIAAVYASNDTMALGAIEALTTVGKNGTVKVCGCDGTEAALNAVLSGDMLCTIANDGYNICGYGAAYSYYAATGVLDLSTMEGANRLIYCKTTFVDSSNVADIIDKFIVKGNPGYDYSDLAACIDSYQVVE
ncbi:MAG: sugar ABC transporter substrate-binding protein [Eubacteriales bacterium]|nr:sugar ABC transporter substrate-binding protein [Eubacteriales bacterium]